MTLRASSMSRIMGHYPNYQSYKEYFDKAKIALFNKLISKPFVPEGFAPSTDEEKHQYLLDTGYFETPPQGTKKYFTDYSKWHQKLNTDDILPDGAKNYLHDLFLKEHGLALDLSFGEISGMQKGTIMEDKAIELVNDVYGEYYLKNEDRLHYIIEHVTFPDTISGEADIIGDNLIRDIKCPQDMKSFIKHSAKGIESNYHWQLITYCILWEVDNACIDFCLMPTPPVVFENWSIDNQNKVREFNSNVELLYNTQRVKTFYISPEVIAQDKIKVLKRAKMASDYYNNLTLNKILQEQFDYDEE